MMLQRGVGSGAALEGTSGLDAGQPRWRAWLGLDRGCFLHHSVSGRMREEYLISKLGKKKKKTKLGESHFNNSTIFLDAAYIPKLSHCFSSPQKSSDLLSDSGCRLLVLCHIRYVT